MGLGSIYEEHHRFMRRYKQNTQLTQLPFFLSSQIRFWSHPPFKWRFYTQFQLLRGPRDTIRLCGRSQTLDFLGLNRPDGIQHSLLIILEQPLTSIHFDCPRVKINTQYNIHRIFDMFGSIILNLYNTY